MYNSAAGSLSPQIMSALGGSGELSFAGIQSILQQRQEEARALRGGNWRERAMASLGGNGANANPPQGGPQPGMPTPPTLPPQANVPQTNPVFGQPIPANMLGSSYLVGGMVPGATGFDLPTY